MFRIKANSPTWLWKDWKCVVGDQQEAGATWFVHQVSERRGRIAEVELAYDAGTRYVDVDCWNGFDFLEDEPDTDVPEPYTQLDNYRDRDRSCFSTACAMLLNWYKPEELAEDGDDRYLKRVFTYGDTTSAYVQLEALGSFGLDAEYSQSKSLDWLKNELPHGPVCIGLLHRGHISKPTGGHWVLVYGYDEDTDMFQLHDPYYGSYDGETGQYESDKPGSYQHWPAEWLKRRWTVENSESGWALWAL